MSKERKRKQQELPFSRKNLYLLGIGLLTLVIGYILMAQPPVDSFWSLTLAPIVLLVAYLVIIPYSILYNDKKNEK